MIEQADIGLIDRNYFEIVEMKDFVLVLRSRNTGHDWCLLERMANGHRTFLMSHRHHAADPYHVQTYRPSVEECCAYARNHDAYHLERERKKNERRRCRQAEKDKRAVVAQKTELTLQDMQ